MNLTTHQIKSITALEQQWLRPHAVWLSSSEREQLELYRHPQRRREWLAGRWLCKRLIQQDTALPLSEIAVQSHDGRRRAAKPRVFVEGRMSPMDVSITHADDWVGVAVSRSQDYRIGIDLVSRTVASGYSLDIWLTSHERQSLRDSPGRTELPILWSIKESVYKATNRGEPFRPLEIEVQRTATGQYECYCQALTVLMECSINVSTHADHVFTITTIQNRSRTVES